MPPNMVDSSSPEAFIRSVAPYAARVSKATGIPVEVLIGMAANETGFGKFAHGNNLFGIKGTGPAGTFNTQTWEDYGQGAVTIRDNFRAYHSPAESFLDFAKLVMTSPRYASAMGQTSVEGFVEGLRRGGYMTDPDYVRKISNIATRYDSVIKEAVRATPAAATAAAPVGNRVPVGRGVTVPDQLNVGLPIDEAMAACGPMAAIAFAQAYGRMPSVAEAMSLAKQSGWTAAGGMNGIANEKRLLDKLGLPAKLEYAVNWDKVKGEALRRQPVIISTPGHYFVVDGFDEKTGKYHVGQSGKVYRGGSEWMTPDQIAAIAGAPSGALYVDVAVPQRGVPRTAPPEEPLPAKPAVAASAAAARSVASSPPAATRTTGSTTSASDVSTGTVPRQQPPKVDAAPAAQVAAAAPVFVQPPKPVVPDSLLAPPPSQAPSTPSAPIANPVVLRSPGAAPLSSSSPAEPPSLTAEPPTPRVETPSLRAEPPSAPGDPQSELAIASSAAAQPLTPLPPVEPSVPAAAAAPPVTVVPPPGVPVVVPPIGAPLAPASPPPAAPAPRTTTRPARIEPAADATLIFEASALPDDEPEATALPEDEPDATIFPDAEPERTLDVQIPAGAAIGAIVAQPPKPQVDPDNQPVRRRRMTLSELSDSQDTP